MNLWRRFSGGNVSLTRIEAFSDGVFAIVVTLLVLELKVPALKDHASVGELWHQLYELLPKFVSWLISFVIVCKFWLNQSHLLGMAGRADYGLAWVNALFLLGQSFIPFPTALAGEYPHNPLAVSFFGVVFALNTLLFILLYAYIQRNVMKPEAKAQDDPGGPVKGSIGVASYLLGAVAAWFSIHLAFLIYALTPIFYITPRTWKPKAAKRNRSSES